MATNLPDQDRMARRVAHGSDPEARISHEAMMRLWDELARRTANEQLGLHMAQLARSSPTVINCGTGCSNIGAAMNDRTSSILWTN